MWSAAPYSSFCTLDFKITTCRSDTPLEVSEALWRYFEHVSYQWRNPVPGSTLCACKATKPAMLLRNCEQRSVTHLGLWRRQLLSWTGGILGHSHACHWVSWLGFQGVKWKKRKSSYLFPNRAERPFLSEIDRAWRRWPALECVLWAHFPLGPGPLR